MSRRPPSGIGDGDGGRGRPPVHSRFQPGQSGNPGGRPKRSKNMATLLEAELSQTVTINENGKRLKLSKRHLVIKQAVNKAAAGDPRMLLALLKHFGADPGDAQSSAPETVLDGEDDQKILQAFLDSVKDDFNESK